MAIVIARVSVLAIMIALHKTVIKNTIAQAETITKTIVT